jgi:hypothetical protein
MDLNLSLCDTGRVSGCNRVIFSQVNKNVSPLYRNISAPMDGEVIHVIFLCRVRKDSRHKKGGDRPEWPVIVIKKICF